MIFRVENRLEETDADISERRLIHLVSIQPFLDGNGRTARLLMNLLLMIHGYPPAIIRTRDRLRYIRSLEKAQLGGDRRKTITDSSAPP